MNQWMKKDFPILQPIKKSIAVPFLIYHKRVSIITTIAPHVNILRAKQSGTVSYHAECYILCALFALYWHHFSLFCNLATSSSVSDIYCMYLWPGRGFPVTHLWFLPFSLRLLMLGLWPFTTLCFTCSTTTGPLQPVTLLHLCKLSWQESSPEKKVVNPAKKAFDDLLLEPTCCDLCSYPRFFPLDISISPSIRCCYTKLASSVTAGISLWTGKLHKDCWSHRAFPSWWKLLCFWREAILRDIDSPLQQTSTLLSIWGL